METERVRRDERMESRLENEEIARSLKESEAQVQSLELTVNELRVQSKLSEQVDFHRWLESVILNDENSPMESVHGGSSAAFDSKARSDFADAPGEDMQSVTEMVGRLLEEWRHEHPHHVVE